MIADLLQARREALGVSARALSLRAGLSESVVGKLESGACQPSLAVFARVVEELGLNDREIGVLVRLAARDKPVQKNR